MSGPEMKSLGWKIVPWFMNLVCALLTAWAVRVNEQLTDIQKEVQSLKEWRAETAGNRYTAKDHVAYADGQAKEIQGLWSKIADLQQVWLKDMGEIKIALASVPKRDENPPQWFRDYVKTLEERIQRHEQENAKQ